MGLRAFSSQLLCEQVVGRGLRRTSYETNPETGLFEPEYVNIFGDPFTFLPHEGGQDGPPPPPDPKTAIEPDPAKSGFEIHWPNVVRIERVFVPTLTLDWSKTRRLDLDAGHTAQVVYVFRGVVRKYRPDFLARLKSGEYLVLETKGQDTEQDKVKRRYLDEWTHAVNTHGGFGHWRWAVAKTPGEIRDILNGR